MDTVVANVDRHRINCIESDSLLRCSFKETEDWDKVRGIAEEWKKVRKKVQAIKEGRNNEHDFAFFKIFILLLLLFLSHQPCFLFSFLWQGMRRIGAFWQGKRHWASSFSFIGGFGKKVAGKRRRHQGGVSKGEAPARRRHQ